MFRMKICAKSLNFYFQTKKYSWESGYTFKTLL